MTKEQVARINELARKKKTVGLTEDELKEQAELRAEYLSEFKKNGIKLPSVSQAAVIKE